MYRPISTLIFALACILTIVPSMRASDWQAGTATTKITPQKLMWMSGYGSRDRPAEGTLTELWAKALVVEDEDRQRVVLVTLDLIGMDRNTSIRICAEIERLYGLPHRSVALCFTHTHTGPVVGKNLLSMYFFDEQQGHLVEQYTRELEKKVVGVVGEAIGALAPARIRWGRGRATFAVNRRNNKESEVPELRAEGKLQGPVDHDVPVLAVYDTDDRLRTIVCGYACHATVLSFFKWSGDWPGFAQIELEKRHPDTTAMVWIGCGADQNPLPRRRIELAEKYGAELADAVDQQLEGSWQPISGKLAATYAEVPLPFASIPTREELETTKSLSNRFEVNRAKRLLKILDRDSRISKTYPYPIQTVQLGDGPLLVMLGGEVVVDFSVRLKTELGRARTWVAGYANDVMAYIPSRRVLREGGYEGGGAMLYYGLPNRWAEGVEQLIVDEVHRQAKRVRQAAVD